MRKLVAAACLGLILIGCASDPLMTGLPQDWQGKRAEDLRHTLGEPTRIQTESDGSEVWEYRESGDFVAPGEEHTSFRMGGASGSGMFGAHGGIKTLKSGEREARYENVARFKIRNGKVKAWYAERLVDGERVWSDH